MKLLNLMLADAAAAASGKFYIHGGGISALTASEFPYVHPQMAIFVTLVREAEVPGTDHSVEIARLGVQADDHESLIETNVRIPDDAAEEGPMHLHFVGELFGMEYAEEGLYWFAVFVDDAEVGRVPLQVGGEPPRVLRVRS